MLCSQIIRLAFIPALLALSSLPSPLPAQEEPSQPVQRDLDKFGQLPVRFNGRVTTYDVVAKNYLRRFGGRDVCFDADDQEQPAVRWLLDVMANHPDRDRWRVVRIRNADVLKRLELEPHKNAKHTRHHYSLRELRLKFPKLSRALQDIYEKPWPKRRTSDRLLIDLYDHLMRYLLLEMIDQLNSQNLQQWDHSPLPRFVPTADGKSWHVFYRADLLNRVADKKNAPKNRFVEQLETIIQAHRAENPKRFNQAVSEYLQSVAGIQAMQCPFEMSPPDEWLEMGAAASPRLHYYSDANAMGHKIMELYLEDTLYSEFVVNYFRGQDVSRADLINSWRISLGLVPLPASELKKRWKPTKIANRNAILVDAETPPYVDLPERKRFLTTILREGDQTFVFAWSGKPAIVEKYRNAHDQLMKSIQMKSSQELAQWFFANGEPPSIPARDFLAAVVPDGKQVWVFVVSAFDDELANHRQDFRKFLESVKLTKSGEGRTQLDWQLPEGWSKVGEYGETSLRLGRDEKALSMMITPLGEATDQTVATLVEHWAKKIHAGKLSKKQRDDCIKEIQVSGRKAYLIELHGLETDSNPSKAAEGLTHKAPKNWELQQPGAVVQTSYEISEGTDKAKVSIVSLPARDNLALNINRWRQQLKLPPAETKNAIADTESVTIGRQKGTFVDLHNPETKQRILAAVVKHGEKDWYFKMMGEAALVEKERKNFRAFLKSVKFPDATEAVRED